jgi:hypothetical protein
MSRRLAAAAAAAAVLSAPAARALPPTPLTTYSTSKNVRLVTNIPTGVGVGGKFAGGFYFQTTARLASYGAGDAASDGGLWVFDVRDPEAPKVAAHLPLPIWQNEDVDLSMKRKILLISADRRKSVSQVATSPIVPGTLFVYDIADPTRPVLKSALPLEAEVGKRADGTPLGGPGHVANCIRDCEYAYVVGSRDRSVTVVDLRDPAAPKVIGKVATPAGGDNPEYSPGTVHDVHTDKYGNVFMAGSGGTAMYAPITNPLKPKLLASTSKKDNARTNRLIHHNTMRLDRNTVLVGEEAFGGCGGEQDGRFQTWRIDLRAKRLVPIALFERPIAGVADCSNHWFDINPHRVVADAFYTGGVRFLDVKDPRRIRQVGYFRTSDGAAGQAQFVPGRPDLVYVSDYKRGLDVIKIDNGGAKAKTVVEDVVSSGVPASPIRFEASEEFGYACPVPVL